METQKQTATEPAIPFVQPDLPSSGFLIFRYGARDEEAYLGSVDANDADEATYEAILRWPEHADCVCPVEALWTSYHRAKMEAELLRDPWPFAYHHAGHIVAACSFGWTVAETCLRPRVHSWDGRFEPNLFACGFTRLGKTDLAAKGGYEAGDKYATYFLAGSVAEYRFDPSRTNWGYTDDIVDAGLCIINSDDNSCVGEDLERLKIRAERLIDRHWPSIEDVAGVLVERRELTGRGLSEILNRTLSEMSVDLCLTV